MSLQKEFNVKSARQFVTALGLSTAMVAASVAAAPNHWSDVDKQASSLSADCSKAVVVAGRDIDKEFAGWERDDYNRITDGQPFVLMEDDTRTGSTLFLCGGRGKRPLLKMMLRMPLRLREESTAY